MKTTNYHFAIRLMGVALLFAVQACDKNKTLNALTDLEKGEIKKLIQQNIDGGIEATRTKNIDEYMKRLPSDLIIYDESGEVISRERQREFALRDWSIIDTTLFINMTIDSIQFPSKDSVIVFTSQRWERMMFRRDGITTDTVVTTQRHREVWKKNLAGWFGYEVLELGGQIFINGELYQE